MNIMVFCTGNTAVNGPWKNDLILRQPSLLKEIVINRTIFSSLLMPLLKIGQFNTQHCRLNRIKTKIAAYPRVVIFWCSTMISVTTQSLGEIGIASGDHAAVTHAAKIF